MPLNLSFTHIMVVLIVALIVLGPDKLPEAARSIARVVREVRKMSAGLQAEVRDTFGDFAEPFSELVDAVSGGVSDAVRAPDAPLAGPSLPSAPPLEMLPSLGAADGPHEPGPPPRPSAPAPGTFAPGPALVPADEQPIVVPPLGPVG